MLSCCCYDFFVVLILFSRTRSLRAFFVTRCVKIFFISFFFVSVVLMKIVFIFIFCGLVLFKFCFKFFNFFKIVLCCFLFVSFYVS